jgi:Ala-tRNA(Pro) deacylase
MNIPHRISHFLDKQHIEYQLLQHQHSQSSISTAVNSLIPYQQIAKAVILLDHEDRKLMAILPADRRVNLSKVSSVLHHDYRLAKEQQVYTWFDDCEHGAIPPIANVFHMNAIYDECLMRPKHIFFEAGDHRTLIRVDHRNFSELMQGINHFKFSQEFMH